MSLWHLFKFYRSEGKGIFLAFRLACESKARSNALPFKRFF